MKYYKILIKTNHLGEFAKYVSVESDKDLQEQIEFAAYENTQLDDTPTVKAEEISVYEYVEYLRPRCAMKVTCDYVDKFYTGSLKGDEIKFELEAKAIEKFLEIKNVFEN